ncbi:superoxide dismutase family protein [Paenibacillus sp. SYP-B3998]|uniref:Superoxide dismutase [Cu-Zn] n=1 Tax=Paenibacillus sp. SYP-B3998 TaxID=2678564 RepID=A0A6G3ZTG8_9BACL|nr:superoxide dismutase family protein [Paenibacillus sp. SYP-B3998]NEW05360.1 superoxide dismutase family protein [Paenibacillus sp. SYP-B3998]
MKPLKILMSASMIMLVISGCQTVKQAATIEAPTPAAFNVPLISSAGQTIGGAKLTSLPEGVRIEVQVSGLKPGAHGLHFHEKAVCEAPNFDTAGAHFNPHKKQHGFKNPKGAHAGDLPNLIVDKQGNGKFDAITKTVVLLPDKPDSLLKPGGTSIIIHEQEDDLLTDPTGNSGKRIACGAVNN